MTTVDLGWVALGRGDWAGAWFGTAERLELLRSTSEPVADRLHVSYRLRLRRAGERWNVVEQHLLCAHDGGRITALDLVCTGFRPE